MHHCCVKVLALSLSLSLFGCRSQADPQAQLARWHNNQGVVYMDQHNYSRGRDEFSRAAALDPAYANAYANLGIAYYSLGKYDSALVALQTALRHDPAQLHAHYTLGLIFLAQGKDYDQALQAFEKVRQADADDPLIHYYLGRAEEKLGQGEAALEAYRQTIRLDPYNVSAYYALAQQLRQLGRQEEFQQVLATFNQLQQAGHEGVSSSYQGQGKYAEAAADAEGVDPERDDAQGSLEFAQATPLPLGFPAELRLATAADWDQDGDPDLLVGGDRLQLWRNEGGSFAPAQAELPAGLFQGAVFADADNDQDLDLVLCGGQTLLASREGPGWKAAQPIAGPSQQAVFADVDHDGDLDLLVLGQGGNQLLANDGTGKFAEITARAGLGPGPAATQAIFSDFDNDRDLDFFLLGPGIGQLFTNNRDGTFADIAAAAGLNAVDAVDAWVEDFDQDGYMDLCALSAEGQLTLWVNQRGRQFEPQSLPAVEGPVSGLRSADLDDDGDLDLLAFGEQGIQLLARRGGQFQREGQVLKTGAAVGQVAVDDFDGNGSADVWADGHLWPNRASGSWIAVALQGLNSNRSAIGAKVEVRTAHRQQKREVRGGSRDGGVLHFGLAGADSVEFVRILWPGGVRQTELATGARQRLTLTELNRKGTSCPILYAWDGAEFRFVTDILGGAIIGYLLAPGQYFAPDTDEYVRLGRLAPREGRYAVQIADQLEEVIYLDAVHLLAVDHPEGVEIFPNERLLSSPPYPEFRLYPLADLQPPRRAVDQGGAEVLAALQAIDDQWYEGFGLAPIHGYAQDYSLTLDLGDLSRNRHPVLLGYGWVDYAHSSSNWAAAQQGLELCPPRLEVPGPDGKWRAVAPDMGCPAGLPKHLLFDLSGLFPADDYRVRITTNTPIYWDQFLVGEAMAVPTQITRLLPAHGDLHWRGYPAHTAIGGKFAFRYHYDQLQTEAEWGTHGGAFTRLGEVTELLGEADDRYVIMFHGDELTAEFDAAALPPLAPGQRRTFLLYADGFGKDMDFHSAHSLTVGPLPFHGMSSYPYPAAESYPLDAAHLRYLLDYNTRRVRGYYD